MSAEIPTGYRLPLVEEGTWLLPDPTMEAIKSNVAVDVPDDSTPVGAAVANLFVLSVPDPDSAIGGVLAGEFVSVSEYDVRKSLLAGEEFPNNGVLDATPLILRAHQAAASLAAFTQQPVQVVYPEGVFRVTAVIPAYNRVGVRGQGMSRTVFKLEGLAVFQKGNLIEGANAAGNIWLDDNIYEDFWVDCYGQSAGTYDTSLKSFFMQNMRRPRWNRVRSSGSWATNLGCDFIIDGQVNFCYFEDSGRGRTEPIHYSGTGAGIGIGCGRTVDEKLVVRNTIMRGSSNNAGFVEKLDARGATLQTRAVEFHSCIFDGAPIALSDCGSGGILTVDCTFRYRNVGLQVQKSGQAAEAGRDGHCIRGVFEQYGTSAPGGTGTNSAIFFGEGPKGGGYIIEDPVARNVIGNFITVNTTADLSSGGIDLRLAGGMNVGGSILRIGRTALPIDIVRITGHVSGWGASRASRRDAISIEADVTDFRCTAKFRGHGLSGAETTGVYIGPDVVFGVPPRMVDNTYQDLPLSTSGLGTHSQALTRGNAEYFSGGTPLYIDTFSRPDSTTLGNTESGRALTPATWEILPPTNGWLIASGFARRNQAVGSGGSIAVIETANSNGRVRVLLNGRQGSPTIGGAVCRASGQSDYILLTPYGSGGFYALQKVVAGTTTTLFTSTVAPVFGTDVMELRMDGTQVSAVVNDVTLTTQTVSDGLLNTKHGMRSHTTWTNYDWFTFTEVV